MLVAAGCAKRPDSGGGLGGTQSSLPSVRIGGHWKYLFDPKDPSKGYHHLWFNANTLELVEQDSRGTIRKGRWIVRSENPSERTMVFEWQSGGRTKLTRATLKLSQDYRMATYESIVSHFGTLKAFEDTWTRVDDAVQP